MSVAKDAVKLSSLTGRQHWLAERPIGGKHRSSQRPPLSATEWIVGHPSLADYGRMLASCQQFEDYFFLRYVQR